METSAHDKFKITVLENDNSIKDALLSDMKEKMHKQTATNVSTPRDTSKGRSATMR